MAAREAAVAPVSDLLRKTEVLPPETGYSLCEPRWARCESTASAALGGKIGGSKVKREKGTVLWHRSSSQRRAVPAALFGAFQDKENCFRTIQEKRIGAAFGGLVPGDGAYESNYPRAATVFRVIQVAPIS